MLLTLLAPRIRNAYVNSRRYVAPGESYHGHTSLVAWMTLPAMATADLVKYFGGQTLFMRALGSRECFLLTKFSLLKERRWGTFLVSRVSLRY